MDVTAYLQSQPVSEERWQRMYKPAYRYRRINAHHVPLFYQQLSSLVADLAHLSLRYRATCSKLFNVPADCQRSPDAHAIACPYLSRSLIFAAAPRGTAQYPPTFTLDCAQFFFHVLDPVNVFPTVSDRSGGEYLEAVALA